MARLALVALEAGGHTKAAVVATVAAEAGGVEVAGAEAEATWAWEDTL